MMEQPRGTLVDGIKSATSCSSKNQLADILTKFSTLAGGILMFYNHTIPSSFSIRTSSWYSYSVFHATIVFTGYSQALGESP